MKIFKTVNRVPGGLMVVPLFLGMVLNTFFPDLLRIGGFTQALTGVGYPTVLGMYLFTVGTKMTFRAAPRMLLRGGGILFAKVGTATLFALAIANYFGGSVLGLSTLAVMVAMSDTNGGMFLALTSVMGNKEDSGTYVVQSVETGPFLTMLIFVGAGLAVIPWLTMLSVIAPILAGAILGNLDDDIKEFFGSHEPIIVPFMAFTLGQTINLRSVVTAGLPGVILGITVVVVTGFVCILADKLLGGSGIAGAAASRYSREFRGRSQGRCDGRQHLPAGRRGRDRSGGRIGDRDRDSDPPPHLLVVQARACPDRTPRRTDKRGRRRVVRSTHRESAQP